MNRQKERAGKRAKKDDSDPPIRKMGPVEQSSQRKAEQKDQERRSPQNQTDPIRVESSIGQKNRKVGPDESPASPLTNREERTGRVPGNECPLAFIIPLPEGFSGLLRGNRLSHEDDILEFQERRVQIPVAPYRDDEA